MLTEPDAIWVNVETDDDHSELLGAVSFNQRQRQIHQAHCTETGQA
jgi:hypothetical protein